MRDVTPSALLQNEIILFIRNFLKNPINEIAHLPEWSWGRLLKVQIIFAALAGAVSGLISLRSWQIFQGIFLFPIISTILGLVLASFFYYFFQVFEKRTVPFIKLATLVFIAYYPFYVFYIPSEYFAISSLFGMSFTGMLLVVGLSSNFNLEKKKSAWLVGILIFLVFTLWGAEKIRNIRLERTAEQAMPQI